MRIFIIEERNNVISLNKIFSDLLNKIYFHLINHLILIDLAYYKIIVQVIKNNLLIPKFNLQCFDFYLFLVNIFRLL